MADKSVTVNVVVERGLAARFKSMSDDLAHVHTVLIEAKAKAAAYDVLTEALRSHLSDCDARRHAVSKTAILDALDAAKKRATDG